MPVFGNTKTGIFFYLSISTPRPESHWWIRPGVKRMALF